MIGTMVAVLAAQSAEPAKVVVLGEEEEIAMALSAAPEHLRGSAGVLRMRDGQYGQMRASTNGFNCLVAREPSLGLAPVCYDAEGTRTNLQADIFRGTLRAAGKSETEVDLAVAAAYADGRLKAPSKPGIAYMLSPNFTQVNAKTGHRQCIFPPHVMFYAPYLKNSDIGAEQKHFGSTQQPWILNEGEPGAHILIVNHGADLAACR